MKRKKSKQKYWYRDRITICVLCGKKTHNKKRVFSKNDKGTLWEDGVCSNHFFNFYETFQ